MTLSRRRWMSNNYITWVKTGSQSVGDKMRVREPSPSRGGPSGPRLSSCSWSSEPQMSWREDAGMRTMSQRGSPPPVEQPRRTEKKRCSGHKSGGQYVAVLFSLQLTSHTVKPLVTLSNPFK